MPNKNNKIPRYVADWTYKYFHQSAFDVPLNFPNKRVVNFLTQFRKNGKIKLYRGENKYNKENYTGIKSWTYNRKIAARYADEIGGKIISKMLDAKKILLDTTLLNEQERFLLGYDYKVNDEEVLIIT